MFGFVFSVALLVLHSPLGWGQLSQISTSNPAVQQQIVDAHNAIRSAVQPTATDMLEMSWNSEAAANAQMWANTCSLKHSDASQRITSTSGCGENIYESSTMDSWDSAIKSWVDEVNNYQYGEGSKNGKDVGHYTQLVWYRSNEIGCAVAHCPNLKLQYFYVCQYCPAGNTQFHHPYLEGPSCGACPNDCKNKLCTNPCPVLDKYGNCGAITARYGCSHATIARVCKASCQCQDKIK